MPPVAVAEFQDALGELAARSGEAADKLLARISVLSPAEARAFITDAYPALLDPFLKASSDLTQQWYAEQPAAPRPPGAGVFVPQAAPMRAGDQLAISGRWALTTPNPATALRGNATRQVMNQSRDTVVLNAEREGVRWVRHAKQNACGFCKMLATRAAKDLSQYSYRSQGVSRKYDRDGQWTGDYTLTVIGKRGRLRGKRKFGSEYHDHCRCTAVPIRDGRYEPPDYVQQWTDEYDAIVAEHGTGDLLKISNLMDLGRMRPDRVAAPLMNGPDLFAPPPADPITAPAPDAAAEQPVNLDVPKTPKPRTYDEVEADFQAAIEAGDDAAIDRLADELEAVAAAEAKAAERAAKAKARREAADMAKWDKVGELIDQGYDPLEAESDVFGKSMDKLRRRDFIAQARADGHRGAGFDELLTSVYNERISELVIEAENATRGVLFNRQAMNRLGVMNLDARKLWTANEATARSLMSEELAAWFDANGRLTKSAMREMILDGRDTWRSSMTSDFLQ